MEFYRIVRPLVDDQSVLRKPRYHWEPRAEATYDPPPLEEATVAADLCHLPIRLLGAIVRCKAETVLEVLELSEEEIASQMKGTEEEKQELLSILRRELTKFRKQES